MLNIWKISEVKFWKPDLLETELHITQLGQDKRSHKRKELHRKHYAKCVKIQIKSK